MIRPLPGPPWKNVTIMGKENIVILKYNAGNISSVYSALKRLGINALITGDKERIRSASKVIFPGVGEASSTMAYLRSNGMDRVISGLKQPVLGICLGMHLLCSFSGEGGTTGIGVFDEEVKRFVTGKVPHMGWNSVSGLKGPLFEGTVSGTYFYFVHSYYVPPGEYSVAESNYGISFAAAMQRDNFFATQFHPEKSGDEGEEILKRFIQL